MKIQFGRICRKETLGASAAVKLCNKREVLSDTVRDRRYPEKKK